MSKEKEKSLQSGILGLISGSKLIQAGIMAIMFGIALSIMMGGKIDLFGIVEVDGVDIDAMDEPMPYEDIEYYEGDGNVQIKQ